MDDRSQIYARWKPNGDISLRRMDTDELIASLQGGHRLRFSAQAAASSFPPAAKIIISEPGISPNRNLDLCMRASKTESPFIRTAGIWQSPDSTALYFSTTWVPRTSHRPVSPI